MYILAKLMRHFCSCHTLGMPQEVSRLHADKEREAKEAGELVQVSGVGGGNGRGMLPP